MADKQQTEDLNWVPRAVTRGFLVLLIIGLLILGWLTYQVNAAGGITRSFFTDARLTAKTQCEQYVLKAIKTPSSASFSTVTETDIRDAGVNGWVVDGWLDAQNNFGAMVRSNYHCAVSPGPLWTLNDLTVTPR